QQQKREAKKNKEVRQKMREEAILHRNTYKMQRAIDKYKEIPKSRKMTAVEKEKLASMEKELEETLARQREAGIDPKKWETQDNAAGYDPLAAANAADDDSEQSDDDGAYGYGGNDTAHTLTGVDDLGIQTVSYFGEPAKKTEESNEAVDDNLPPMPPGTPPLLPQDLEIDAIWPPLPKGPSPMYKRENLQHKPHGSGSHGNPVRHHQNYRQHRQTPYSPNHRGQQRPASASEAPKKPIPVATVLAAEPEVRNLQKELRSFVPAAIARKQKQKERQRVIASVPSAPKMIVNAAPDVDVGPSASGPMPRLGPALRNAIKPAAGVQFKTAPTAKEPTLEAPSKDSSLDDEYQKFMKEMNDFL
ncbi:hypothetical protein EC988_004992, partial [Linderina pennispora]